MFEALLGRARALVPALSIACGTSGEAKEPVEPVRPEPDPPAPVLARVEASDAWLDLIGQRPGAVVSSRGLLQVDLGHESARKHLELGHGLRLGAVDGDRRGAVVTGRTAAFDLPIDGELAPVLAGATAPASGLAVAVTLRPTAERQAVTLLLNEKPVAHLRLSAGWQRRTVSLPKAAVLVGENRLRLHFLRIGSHEDQPAAAIVQWLELGEDAAIAAGAPAERAFPSASPRQSGATTLRVPAGTTLAYYVIPPRRGRLHLRVSGRGSLSVAASTDADHRAGRAPTVLWREPLRPTVDEVDLDLSTWSETPVRLQIAVAGADPEAGATLEQAAIQTRRTIAIDRRARRQRDVILVGIEGARADEVLDPARRPELPSFERLLGEGLVFERAYAVAAAAVPSHAAILSSIAPPAHLTVRGTFVAQQRRLLPEILRRNGYSTALVTGNPYVRGDRGLAQGFDRAETLERGSSHDSDAREVLQRVSTLITSGRGPHFVYAVLSDPQAPFDPPRELVRETVRPEGAPLPHHTHVWVGQVRMAKRVPTPEEVTYVRRLYRGELQLIDEALGALLRDLEAGSRLEQAVIVLFGVHGEEFLEHGGAGHGHALHEENVHVPLVIRAPALLAPGRVRTPVDLVDLAPTLADLLGIEDGESWQGESLLPLVDDPQPPPRLLVQYLGDGSRTAIVGDFKLWLGAGRSERMYDLRVDPFGREDVLAEGGIALRVLRAAMAFQLPHETKWSRARWGTGANLAEAFALDHGM